jgi:hypothetical protein
MPSRKQRRRRQKDRRHEYEYVYVDEEGHELDPDEVEIEEEKPAAKGARGNGTTTRTATKAKPKQSARKGAAKQPAKNIRPVPPPSWKRVLKRGAIFAPFMLLAITLLGRGLSWPARILETVWLLVLFVPFSYMIDRMMYRRYLRQIGQEPPTRQRRA